MVVILLKNYLGLLLNVMEIFRFLSTKYQVWGVKEILITQLIVFIQFTWQKSRE